MATEPSVASSHIEHLIGEIESSDGLLGPTLRCGEITDGGLFPPHMIGNKMCLFLHRAVYDGNQPKELLEKLEDRIRTHDKDIERMCNYHYQGFIESVNELLKVRGEAKKLKVGSYAWLAFRTWPRTCGIVWMHKCFEIHNICVPHIPCPQANGNSTSSSGITNGRAIPHIIHLRLL